MKQNISTKTPPTIRRDGMKNLNVKPTDGMKFREIL